MLKSTFTLVFFFLIGCTSAQKKIASYGSIFIYWTEFSFYDDFTFEHKTLRQGFNLEKEDQAFKKTRGKYKIQGDTIFILKNTQNTYQHGNISCKYLMVKDSLIIDLDLLWDYTKISSLNELKDKAKNAKLEKDKENILCKYLSHFHPIKFPYIPLESTIQKKVVKLILEDFFLRKQVSSFFKSDSIILSRFFYKIDMEALQIVIPHKSIKFIRPIEAKRTEAKRIEFNKFIILENKKTIFIGVTLYQKRGGGKAISYSAEYRKKKHTWRLKYMKKQL
jgi:hypothetical protein